MTNSQQEKTISTDLNEHIQLIKKEFGHSQDLSIRQLVSMHGNRKIAILHLSGIVDDLQLTEHIMEPIIKFINLEENQFTPNELPQFNTIFSRILAYSQDFITLEMDLTIK